MVSIAKGLKNKPLVAYAAFFFLIPVMGMRPLVPLYSISLGMEPGEIGILVAMFSVIPLFLAILVGKWIDQHSTRGVLIASVLVASLGIVLPFLASNRLGMYLSQLIVGSGFTVFVLAAQKNVGALGTDSWTRERSIAVFSMGVALGSLLGPLIGGVLADYFGYNWAFLILGLTGLLALIFVTSISSEIGKIKKLENIEDTKNTLQVFSYHQYLGRAFLISALILLAKDMYVAYFPLYAYGLGASASLIGLIIAIHNGGGVIMRFFLLPLVKKFGKNRVVVLSILFSGLFFLMIPLTDNIFALALISLAIGLGLGLGQPLSISTTINLSPEDKTGTVLGLRLTFNRLTQVVSPLTFGGIVMYTGVASTFWIVGLILVFGCFKVSIPEGVETESAHNSNS